MQRRSSRLIIRYMFSVVIGARASEQVIRAFPDVEKPF